MKRRHKRGKKRIMRRNRGWNLPDMSRFFRKTERSLKGIGRIFNSLYKHIVSHWPRYVLSFVTATFTFHAALVFTGQAYYAIMAVILCEGMLLHWMYRLETFENSKQMALALIMFTLACIAVVGTDVSSAILLANDNDKFTIYSNIPESVQWLVTNITPILASTNLIVYGLYEFFSDSNADKREHSAKQRLLNRILKSSDRDMQKLRARARVLRRERDIQRTHIKHAKQYGDLVISANKKLGLEVESEEKKHESLIKRVVGFFNTRRWS